MTGEAGSIEAVIAGAVVAQLIPEIQRVVRAELAAQLAALHAPAAQAPELLSVREFAKRAGLSTCTIRRRVADESLPHIVVGTTIRIPSSALRPADPADVAQMARAARTGT
ncbi:MAG: hypothetical protein WBP56_14505 [Polyangia bacterium]